MSGDGARETGTYLDRILVDRRRRLAEERRRTTEDELASRASELPGEPVDFAARLREGRAGAPASARLRLIAEIKRASPSKGLFDVGLDAGRQAGVYSEAGAAAISVLTEPDHFRGSGDDLLEARRALAGDRDRPALLRKDFIFDAWQVHEARALGADALLLIVAMLEPSTLRELLAVTRDLGMEALVEVHDEPELAVASDAGARIIGVNNRDLRTFEEDLGTFERLAPSAPAGVTLVAESAIREAGDAERMADAGAHAILVGEALVTSGDVPSKARELTLATEAARTGAKS
jgi:indole-3-glycerol phosphate synthase